MKHPLRPIPVRRTFLSASHFLPHRTHHPPRRPNHRKPGKQPRRQPHAIKDHVTERKENGRPVDPLDGRRERRLWRLQPLNLGHIGQEVGVQTNDRLQRHNERIRCLAGGRGRITHHLGIGKGIRLRQSEGQNRHRRRQRNPHYRPLQIPILITEH